MQNAGESTIRLISDIVDTFNELDSLDRWPKWCEWIREDVLIKVLHGLCVRSNQEPDRLPESLDAINRAKSGIDFDFVGTFDSGLEGFHQSVWHTLLSCAEAVLQDSDTRPEDLLISVRNIPPVLPNRPSIEDGLLYDWLTILSPNGGLIPRRVKRNSEVLLLLLPAKTSKQGSATLEPRTLRLELVLGGAGRVYRHPKMAHVFVDSEFQSSIENAHAYVRGSANASLATAGDSQPPDYDVRWSLVDMDNLDPCLFGPSAGGAIALGLCHLLIAEGKITNRRLEPVKTIDLSKVTIAACLDDQGNLTPVGGIEDKIDVAARRSNPKLFGVAVSSDSVLREGMYRVDRLNPQRWNHSEEGLHVYTVSSLVEAIEFLAVETEIQRLGIPDFDKEFARHQFYHDVGLNASVDNFVAHHSKGYLLLEAGPHFGKSAFVSAQMNADSNANVVGHFIRHDRPDLKTTDQLLQSLVSQLRLKHRIPPKTNEDLRVQLINILNVAGKSPGGETIYIDGLDEIDRDQDKRLIPDTLPKSEDLPDGIRVILTSRPGVVEAWGLVDDLDLVVPPISPSYHVDSDTVLKFIATRLRQLADQDPTSDINELLADHDLHVLIAQRVGKNIGLATVYLERPYDLVDWWKGHKGFPPIVSKWLESEWRRIPKPATDQDREALRLFLDVFAIAKEDLSIEQIHTLLEDAHTTGMRDYGTVSARSIVDVSQRIESLRDSCATILEPRLAPGTHLNAADVPYGFPLIDFEKYAQSLMTSRRQRNIHALLNVWCTQTLLSQRDRRSEEYANKYHDYHEKRRRRLVKPLRRLRRLLRRHTADVLSTLAVLVLVAVLLWPEPPESSIPQPTPTTSSASSIPAVASPVADLQRTAGGPVAVWRNGRPVVDERAAIDATDTITVAGGRAEIVWPGSLAVEILNGSAMKVAESDMRAREVALEQIAGTARYRTGSAMDVITTTVAAAPLPMAVNVRPGWLEIDAIGNASHPLDMIVSFPPNDQDALWLGVASGTAIVQGAGPDPLAIGLTSGEAAFFTREGVFPAARIVKSQTTDACYAGVTRGLLNAMSAPEAVCCAIDVDKLLLYRSLGAVVIDARMRQSGSLLLGLSEAIDHSGTRWFKIRAPLESAGALGWAPSSDVDCVAALPLEPTRVPAVSRERTATVPIPAAAEPQSSPPTPGALGPRVAAPPTSGGSPGATALPPALPATPAAPPNDPPTTAVFPTGIPINPPMPTGAPAAPTMQEGG